MKVLKILVVLALMVGSAGQGAALVSEARPGIAYRDQVMFVDKKVVKEGSIAWITLSFRDPRTSNDCDNLIDVFNDRALFTDIPEKSWVLVDFSLRSLVIQAGFSGDADVTGVFPCSDEQACRELQGRRQRSPRQQTVVPSPVADLEDAGQRMSAGRDLIKAARCRGCHVIEGFGAKHAPGLTWRRAKYRPGWLVAYLGAPYRLRPALTSLMMLRYTSPLASPGLQPAEISVVADFLERLAWFTPPAGRYRLEPWQTYQCQPCHARLYAERPLAFAPTTVPDPLRTELDAYPASKTCLACHTFGDLQTVKAWSGPPYPFPMAPDLLLALEKLRVDYVVDYVRDPGYIQPGSTMPAVGLSGPELREIGQWCREVQRLIGQGALRPLHQEYRMQKRP
jgi:mono/diheme cytochrome c family protein